MEITVNSAELLARIRHLNGELPDFAKAAFLAAGEDVRNQTAPYPPVPPDSKYQRTGNLLSRWYVRPEQSSVVVENLAPYSNFVHGFKDKRVKWAAPYGWKSIEDGVERAIAIIKTELSRYIKVAWR